MESHILQVKGAISSEEDEVQEEFSHDIFEVFATEKKKREGKPSKAPELSAPPPAARASTPPPPPQTRSSDSRPNSQYRYHSNAEDTQLVSELEEYLMQGRLSLTTPAHVFAASPVIRKNIVEKLKVRCVETNEYEAISAKLLQNPSAPPQAARRTTVHDDTSDDFPHQLSTIAQPSAFCLPLQEIDVLVNAAVKVVAILDTGSQIVVIRHDIVQSLGVDVNYQRLIEMEGANGATNWTVVLRSCGLNARLVQKYRGEYLKKVRESLLIIKTTGWQTRVKQFKSFRLHKKQRGFHKSGNFARVKLSQA